MRIALLFTLSALCIAFIAACKPAAAPVAVGNRPTSINDRPTTNLPVQPTKPLDNMSWSYPDQRVHKVADFRGKALILDFWATYCGPCREAIPHLNSLVAKYGDDNLHIVGLNVGGEEDMKKVPEFTKKTRIDYPIALPEDELSQMIFFEKSDIPQTMIIDRSGNVVTKIIGYSEAIKKDLDAAVEQAVRSN